MCWGTPRVSSSTLELCVPFGRGRNTSSGLLDRLGGVFVKAGNSVFLFDEIEPVGCGVLEKMGVNFGTGPEPTFIL